MALATADSEFIAFSAQESLRIISENLNYGLWRTDQSGRFVFANPYMGDIFGQYYKDMVATTFWDLKDMFDLDWYDTVRDHINKMLRGTEGEFDTRIIDLNGNHKYLRISYFPITKGRYLGSVGVIRDITNTKIILDELHRLKD